MQRNVITLDLPPPRTIWIMSNERVLHISANFNYNVKQRGGHLKPIRFELGYDLSVYSDQL